MKKVFLDTNIWIRFVSKDNDDHYQLAEKIISLIHSGELRGYTSSVVILEIHFVLKSVYKLPLDEIQAALEAIVKLRGLTLIEKTNTKEALNLLAKYRIKFADAFIATQLPPDCYLVSFDEEFKKIKGLKWISPKKLFVSE